LDPVHEPSPGCMATKAMLLDGGVNIRLMADHIMRWKRTCKTEAGSGAQKHWLAGYGGMSRPTRGEWCGRRRTQGRWVEVFHRKVQEVLDIRRRLARGLPPRQKSR
jgi:heme A synthase